MPFFSSVLDYIAFIYPFINSSLDSYYTLRQGQLERPHRSLGEEDGCLFQVDFSSTHRMSRWLCPADNQ